MMKKGSSGFSGFNDDNNNSTSIPDEFFHELLPAIEHLGELKVTLYTLWVVGRQREQLTGLRRADFLADDRLLAALPSQGMSPEEALDESLERAVQRGTLLMASETGTDSREQIFFINSPRGRQALEALIQGSWQPEGLAAGAALRTARPNIFVLYEQNIGALTPLLAEKLQEAEQAYPSDWIEQAIGIAVANNVRKWRYVEAILENWKTKGKDDQEDRRDPEETRQRYLGGEFSEFIEH